MLNAKVKQACNYFSKETENEKRDIIIAGHSLGGFLAQVVGYVYGCETHTFNAPGAFNYIEKQGLKRADSINITNHLSADIVSAFGRHVGHDTIYNHHGHSIDSFVRFLKDNNER